MSGIVDVNSRIDFDKKNLKRLYDCLHPPESYLLGVKLLLGLFEMVARATDRLK